MPLNKETQPNQTYKFPEVKVSRPTLKTWKPIARHKYLEIDFHIVKLPVILKGW